MTRGGVSVCSNTGTPSSTHGEAEARNKPQVGNSKPTHSARQFSGAAGPTQDPTRQGNKERSCTRSTDVSTSTASGMKCVISRSKVCSPKVKLSLVRSIVTCSSATAQDPQRTLTDKADTSTWSRHSQPKNRQERLQHRPSGSSDPLQRLHQQVTCDR